MAHNDGSPTYKSDLVMLTRADDRPNHPFEGYVATAAEPAKLWSELSNPSWERRYRAHTEILRRGGPMLEEAIDRLAKIKQGDPAAVHLVWLAGASGLPKATTALLVARQSKEPTMRLQALRALTAYPALKATPQIFLASMSDRDPQVQHAAVLGLFEFDIPVPDSVITGPARSKDTYLRQAATLLLAERGTLAQIQKLCQTDDPVTRLAGVLAAGFRLTLPPATELIPNHLPLDPEFRGPEIEFADMKVDLRKLGRIGNFTLAEHWKVGNHTPEQKQLFAMLLARLEDKEEPIRLQAAHFLSLLNDPRSEPQVVEVRKASEDRRLALAPLNLVDRAWIVGPFADGDAGFDKVHPPEQGAVDLAAQYASPKGTLAWVSASTERIYDFVKLLGPCDNSSMYAYFRLESGSKQRINLLVGSDDGVKLWHNGRIVWTNDTSRAALPFQDVVVLELEPGSNDMLIRTRNLTGASGVYAHYRSLQPAKHTLPDKVGLESLAQRLAAAGPNTQPVPEEFLKVDWSQAIKQGDAAQGKKVFEALGCAKCHAATNDVAVVGGPSLAEAAKRFTVPYLVESILSPNKQISPVFRATAVVLKDGRQFTGLAVGETADKLELLLPDTKRETIAKAEIDQRELQNLSPMPQGVVKKPDELRDLLAFLLSN
jgi:putative heme-binding domain-containing protein